jgi:hypothetical protein
VRLVLLVVTPGDVEARASALGLGRAASRPCHLPASEERGSSKNGAYMSRSFEIPSNRHLN